jgi:hypothetical protein
LRRTVVSKTKDAEKDVWTPQELVDREAAPPWPSGDYASEEYRRDARRHSAYEEQRKRIVEEITVAVYLARKRLPLTALLTTLEGARKIPVFGGPMAGDDPRVLAWRHEIGQALGVGLKVFRDEEEGQQLDYDATTARAEDVLACLRLLRDDVAERGGSIPDSAPNVGF